MNNNESESEVTVAKTPNWASWYDCLLLSAAERAAIAKDNNAWFGALRAANRDGKELGARLCAALADKMLETVRQALADQREGVTGKTVRLFEVLCDTNHKLLAELDAERTSALGSDEIAQEPEAQNG